MEILSKKTHKFLVYPNIKKLTNEEAIDCEIIFAAIRIVLSACCFFRRSKRLSISAFKYCMDNIS